MKPTHLLAGLLSLAAILLDLVVLTGFESGYETPLMLFLGLAFGQLALLSFWCAWGHRCWLPRFMVTVAAAALLSRPLGQLTAGQSSEWFLLFCLFAICVAAATRGVLPQGTVGGDKLLAAAAHPRPVRHWSQFSLGSILSLMTVVGLALGLGRHVAFPAQHALAVAVYGFWLVMIALTGLWALLSRRAVPVRLLLLATLCIVAGLCMAGAERYQSVWFFTMIAFIEAIVICCAITVLQVGGDTGPTETAATP